MMPYLRLSFLICIQKVVFATHSTRHTCFSCIYYAADVDFSFCYDPRQITTDVRCCGDLSLKAGFRDPNDCVPSETNFCSPRRSELLDDPSSNEQASVWTNSYRSGITNFCPLISQDYCNSQLQLTSLISLNKTVEHPGLYNYDIVSQEQNSLFPQGFSVEQKKMNNKACYYEIGLATTCEGSGKIHVYFDQLGSQAGVNVFKGKSGIDSSNEIQGFYDNYNQNDNEDPKKISLTTYSSQNMIVSVYPLLNEEDTAFKFRYWSECVEKPAEPIVEEPKWWQKRGPINWLRDGHKNP